MSTKRKAPTSLPRPAVKPSAKVPTKTSVDESKAAVSTASSLRPAFPPPSVDPIEISSDSSSSYGDLSDREGEVEEKETKLPSLENHDAAQKPSLDQDGVATADVDMADAVNGDDGDSAAPTFGDLLRGGAAGATIDVTSALAPASSKREASTAVAVAGAGSTRGRGRDAPAPPALSSLGTVLNQALRTDDAALLESCLQTTDIATVRATVQRMESSLAAALLGRLAARMHRRPARAHALMAWVQWTLVAHGGALAARPDLVRRLADLNRVLEDRARALPSLLALKGKLDMLDSQMQLRRESLAASGRRGLRDGRRHVDSGAPAKPSHGREEEEEDDEDDDDDGEVVYVEGQGDETINGVAKSKTEEDEVVLVNGLGGETDDDSDDESQDEDDAGSSVAGDGAADGTRPGDDDDDESGIDFDDDESSGDDDEVEEVAAPPAKKPKVGGQRRK